MRREIKELVLIIGGSILIVLAIVGGVTLFSPKIDEIHKPSNPSWLYISPCQEKMYCIYLRYNKSPYKSMQLTLPMDFNEAHLLLIRLNAELEGKWNSEVKK